MLGCGGCCSSQWQGYSQGRAFDSMWTLVLSDFVCCFASPLLPCRRNYLDKIKHTQDHSTGAPQPAATITACDSIHQLPALGSQHQQPQQHSASQIAWH